MANNFKCFNLEIYFLKMYNTEYSRYDFVIKNKYFILISAKKNSLSFSNIIHNILSTIYN